MPGWLQLGVPWWELALRAVVIYLVFFVGLRIFGKREIGQFTVFDLVLVLLVANALQPAMTGPDTSLTGGLILIAITVATGTIKNDDNPSVSGPEISIASASMTEGNTGNRIFWFSIDLSKTKSTTTKMTVKISVSRALWAWAQL